MAVSQKCKGQLEFSVFIHNIQGKAMSGRASVAQVYPRALCKAVCRGAMQEAQLDMKRTHSAGCVDDGRSESETKEINSIELEAGDWLTFWDDMSGKVLDSGRTRKARQDDIERINKMGVWKMVPITKCWERTGKGPVGTRWVDVDKGDVENSNHQASNHR